MGDFFMFYVRLVRYLLVNFSDKPQIPLKNVVLTSVFYKSWLAFFSYFTHLYSLLPCTEN